MKKKQVNAMSSLFIVVTFVFSAHPQWIHTNWQTSNNFFKLYTSQNRIFAQTWDSLNGGRMFLTADSGTTWNLIGAADSGADILSIVMFNNTLLAGTYDGIFRTSSGTMSWVSETSQGIPSDASIWTVTMINSSIFAGANGTTYRSSDSGKTWSELKSGIPAGARITSFVTNGISIFAGSDADGAFLLSNEGNGWTAINSGLSDKHIIQLSVHGDKLFAVTLKGVFLSSNNGTSWVENSSALKNVNCLLSGKSLLLAGTDSSGVYSSSDGGVSWTPYNQGLPPGSRVWSMAAVNGNLYAGTNSGIWRTPFSTSAVVANRNLYQEGSNLQIVRQNKTCITVKFSLPVSGAVDLSLYSISGKLVAPLVENLSVTGLQYFTFDTRAIAPGTYVLRMTTDMFSAKQPVRIKR